MPVPEYDEEVARKAADWADVPGAPDQLHDVPTGTVASKQPRRVRIMRRRLVAIALLLAVLLVTPAFGIGSRIFDVFDQPSPSEAQEQTGVPPTVHLRTDYDGIESSVITYHDAQGRPCFAEQVGSSDEGKGVGWGCGPNGSGTEQVRAQFADGSPVAMLGPTWMQEPSRAGFDPTTWDRMSLDGVTKPAVVRLEVVMTDCSSRHVSFDPDSFDGNGVFLYTVPRADLHAGVWPFKLIAYDAAGHELSSQPIPRAVPGTPAAHVAHTQAPRPLAACR